MSPNIKMRAVAFRGLQECNPDNFQYSRLIR